MAIEFDCPVCATSVRVPDAAAGKKGKCPRCETIVRVPVIEIPAPSGSSAPAPPSPPSQPSVPSPAPAVEDEDARPAWLRKGQSTEPRTPDDPSGFVEADLDAPPDFSAFADDDEPLGEPLIRTEENTPPPPPPAPVDEAPPTEFPTFGASNPAAGSVAAPSPVAPGRGRKRRRNSGPWNWLIPVLGVVGLIGFFVWFQWESRPDLDGTLPAEAYGYLELPPKPLDAKTAGMKPDAFEDLVKALEEPLLIESRLMRVGLRGYRGALEVRVLAGDDTRFVKVPKTADPELATFAKEWRDDLREPRLEELKSGANEFAKAVARDPAGLDDSTRLRMRNRVALHALTNPLGSHLVAIYDNTTYPCCYEDGDAVYFLLPKAARSFVIQGREFDGHGTVFYGKYDVDDVKVIPGEEPADWVDPWFPEDAPPEMDDDDTTDPDDPDDDGPGLDLFGPTGGGAMKMEPR